MGPTHTAVMVKPGQIYTFGRNSEGQLGAGNVKQISGYVEVKAMHDKTVNVSRNCKQNIDDIMKVKLKVSFGLALYTK